MRSFQKCSRSTWLASLPMDTETTWKENWATVARASVLKPLGNAAQGTFCLALMCLLGESSVQHRSHSEAPLSAWSQQASTLILWPFRIDASANKTHQSLCCYQCYLPKMPYTLPTNSKTKHPRAFNCGAKWKMKRLDWWHPPDQKPVDDLLLLFQKARPVSLDVSVELILQRVTVVFWIQLGNLIRDSSRSS